MMTESSSHNETLLLLAEINYVLSNYGLSNLTMIRKINLI
jgi:hypothetical protein